MSIDRKDVESYMERQLYGSAHAPAREFLTRLLDERDRAEARIADLEADLERFENSFIRELEGRLSEVEAEVGIASSDEGRHKLINATARHDAWITHLRIQRERRQKNSQTPDSLKE